ncbi:SRPBCC family protein [Pseudovibrio ascidiaceicola]|uniref:SRPBCC family protein n=1 Tax=Pseudovibrio ascidiaceicola TaxID=285279 RepID=UPI003D36CEE8
MADQIIAIILEPVDLENTVEYVELFYSLSSQDTSELDDLRAKNARLWKTVFKEDIFVAEGMQKGRHGELFDGGKFSPPMDGPTHTFHH